MSPPVEPTLTNATTCGDVTTGARLLQHLKEPQNLLIYLVLSAWAKYMGLSAFIPTIVIA